MWKSLNFFGKVMNWSLKKGLINYFNFKDRANRWEYWGFIIYSNLIIGIARILEDIIYISKDIKVLSGFLSVLFLIPTISIAVRRFHDINKSGWLWFVLMAIILILTISFNISKDAELSNISSVLLVSALIMLGVLFFFLFKKGSEGKNRYGIPSKTFGK